MNEENIIEIYQELLKSIEKIKTSGHTLSSGQQIQLSQYETIVADLKAIADKKGFGDQMIANDDIKIMAADDLFQLIEATSLNAGLKKALKEEIGKDFTDKNLSKGKFWKALKLMDKYYLANVDGVNAVNISTRMKGQWQEIFGIEIKELDLVALAYQESAEIALYQEIRKLQESNWTTSAKKLDGYFVEAFKGKKTWLLAADSAENASLQLKIDLKEYKLPDKFRKSIVLKNGKVMISGKLGFTAPVLGSMQEKVCNEWITLFGQGIRNTISTNFKDIAKKGLSPKGSTTAGTVGFTLNLPLGITLTAKIDGGKSNWSDVYTNAKEGATGDLPSLFAVRFSIQVDVKTFIQETAMEGGLKGTILDDSLCKLAISGGWDLSINWASFAEVEMNNNKVNRSKITAKDIEADNKIAQQIRDKQDELLKHADEMADVVDKKDIKAMKKSAKKMQDSALDIQKLLDSHDFNDKKVRKAVKKNVEEVSAKIYKKLSGPISEMTKAFKYSKAIAKFIPGLNALLTIYEVATFVIGFVNWFNSIEAKNWEDYFIAAGEYLSKNFGGWHRWLDKKLSR